MSGRADAAVNILRLTNGSEVEVLAENLEIINENLRQSGAEVVSIVSIMGAYRTGKSFLLDLMLRYLKTRMTGLGEAQEENAAPAPEEPEGEEEYEIPEATSVPAWRFEDPENKHRPRPDWFLHGDATRLCEGSSNDKTASGFAWRPGEERCTQGIWIWSTPFVFTNKEGRKIAVLLMDTQGAWDATMTQAQSATIFGMTALISSKLIYNIQNKLEEDKLGNLDYITTYVQTVCKDLPGEHTAFGKLNLLIRDWANYDKDMTIEQCQKQVNDHLDKHINPKKVPEDAVDKVERLHSVFRSVECFGLPHPSLKVTKPNYTGDISVIDSDFVHLLDTFMSSILAKDNIQPSAPLGREIRVDKFKDTVLNFAEVFAANQGLAIGLREAFVKVEMIAAREELFSRFKVTLERFAPETAVIDPVRLMEEVRKLDKQAFGDFTAKLKPWKLKQSDEAKCVSEFKQSIEELAARRVLMNDNEVEGATVKLMASPVVCCSAWFLLVHHWILYIVMCCGGGMHAKKWSAKENVEITDAKVLRGVADDVQKWTTQRWKDAQAIQIALNRFNPNDSMDMLKNFQATSITAMAAGLQASQQAMQQPGDARSGGRP